MLKKIVIIFISLLVFYITYNFYPEEKLPEGVVIDSLVVLKANRQMYVYSNSKLQKIYKIVLSNNSVGGKEIEGDRKTPEGIYYITDKNPNSSYHKNLGISYPNQSDIERAKLLGKPPGDNIKIHGIRNGLGFLGKFHRFREWTAGCIAVTNEEIDELFDAVKIGSTIAIKP